MGQSGSGTILVVEDDWALRRLVAEILRRAGFRVVGACNGAEALEQIERAVPRVILLDLQMPEMDGRAFSRALRDRGLRVPTVLMTAGPNAQRSAKEIGARDLLAKPFDVDDLLNKVERLAS